MASDRYPDPRNGPLQRALAISEKVLGPEHQDIAASLDNLATLSYAQGRYAEAEHLYKRAIAIDERALGPEHPDVATGLSNLATFFVDQGRHADVEPLYKRALSINEKILGLDHPNTQAVRGFLRAAVMMDPKYLTAGKSKH